jgi:hypothetical protein
MEGLKHIRRLVGVHYGHFTATVRCGADPNEGGEILAFQLTHSFLVLLQLLVQLLHFIRGAPWGVVSRWLRVEDTGTNDRTPISGFSSA